MFVCLMRDSLDMWQDFKEAARLSAESKAQSAEAEAAGARAKELRMRATGLESDEAAKTNDVARLQGELQAGERVLALAKWRCVKVNRVFALPCSSCEVCDVVHTYLPTCMSCCATSAKDSEAFILASIWLGPEMTNRIFEACAIFAGG